MCVCDRNAEVAAECRFASETAKLVYRHGEHYYTALTALAQALQLLALTTLSDTFDTIRVFENVRCASPRGHEHTNYSVESAREYSYSMLTIQFSECLFS